MAMAMAKVDYSSADYADNAFKSTEIKRSQKAECIYDVAYYFTHTYLKDGDRTTRSNGANDPLRQTELDEGK